MNCLLVGYMIADGPVWVATALNDRLELLPPLEFVARSPRCSSRFKRRENPCGEQAVCSGALLATGTSVICSSPTITAVIAPTTNQSPMICTPNGGCEQGTPR